MSPDAYEAHQLDDLASDSDSDLEAAPAHYPPPGDSDHESDDEPLAWKQQRQPRKRRRLHWRTAAVAAVGGLAVGALVVHLAARPPKRLPVFLEDLKQDGVTSDAPVRIHYRSDDGQNRRDPILPPDCPIPVTFTTDERSADIVVLNTDRYMHLEDGELQRLRRERPWQYFSMWGVESAPNRRSLEDHFNALRDGRQNETAQYEMTYRLNSTVPATYAYDMFDFNNPPLPYDEKRQDRIVAAMITNCSPRNARTLVLDELLSLLPGQLDSFGACRKNADIAGTLKELGIFDAVGQHTRWNEKITLINRYKFTIAFENSNDLDYATEKLWQSFERGTVPLVYGPPEAARRFFPAPNAAIDLADYLPPQYLELSTSYTSAPTNLTVEAKQGVARLAKRLQHLASPEGRDEYEAMLAWKKDGAWSKDPENPLNKVVRASRSQYTQDCRLAGVLRGQEWAKNTWTAP
ncbi:uncharacterized protein JCM10292_007398 [Rhodotorula paludigena]|uniref:uncharacterized protein n=1 Tax=Rhodotorula paludigena TaxID=86838 RepID=UPI00316E481D